MIYTVSDFLCTYQDRVRLVAGQGGLSRQVEEVGILDYELLGGVRGKYQRDNFYANQLVMSSMLYARDDAFQIVEAVKYLVSKGVSGLLIKNVFRLQVPDAAVRYANARNFPLFVATSDDLFFDEVILRVGERVRSLADGTAVEREVDALLASADAGEVRRRALGLNPSFGEEQRATFVLLGEDVAPARMAELEGLYRRSAAAGVGNLLCHHAGRRDCGLLYVETSKGELADHGQTLARTLLADVLDQERACAVGISDVHYDLGELACAIREAMRAARLARASGTDGIADGVASNESRAAAGAPAIANYAELGATRAILPHAGSPEMRAFASDVLAPLREFDAEHGSQLAETLATFVACGQSTRETAETLGQHANTVRYRMEKVARLTGLDHREPRQMVQLALACEIERCQEVLEQE